MIVIGEKINASLAEARTILQERDEEKLSDLAKRQAAAGADFIDVNVGTGLASREEEVDFMKWAVETIQAEVKTPICIDSADPGVLEAGLQACDGLPSLINSAKAEKKSLESILPLAKDYHTGFVALAMDEEGIPVTVWERIEACKRIADACEAHGIPLQSVFFDPLVLPVSTDTRQGLVTLETLREVKKTFPTAQTVMGLSNVSYGLPQRERVNRAFLHMAMFAGLDAVIMDPLDSEMISAVKTGEVLVGKDRHCRRYTKYFRG